MKTVNVAEIIKKHSDLFFSDLPPYEGAHDEHIWHYAAMREACNQSIDLCAENAVAKYELHPTKVDYFTVDKNSILKTKSQII